LRLYWRASFAQVSRAEAEPPQINQLNFGDFR